MKGDKKVFDVESVFGATGVSTENPSKELLDYLKETYEITNYPSEVKTYVCFSKKANINYFWRSNTSIYAGVNVTLKVFEDAVGYTEYKLNLENEALMKTETNWAEVEVVTEDMLVAGVHVVDRGGDTLLVLQNNNGEKFGMSTQGGYVGSVLYKPVERVYTIKQNCSWEDLDTRLTKIWPVSKPLPEQEIKINVLSEVIASAQKSINEASEQIKVLQKGK